MAWVSWFSHERLLEQLGSVPPAEHEAAYYAATDTPAAPAGVT